MNDSHQEPGVQFSGSRSPGGPEPGWQELARQVARQRPLVYALQNTVTSQWVAAGLLAAGASPIMVYHPPEAAHVAARANALVLNLGTWSPELHQALLAAGAAAADRQVPIVLDPVGAGFLPDRTNDALDLLARLPVAVVRGNMGEILGLMGVSGQVRGVDSAVAAGTVPDGAATAAAAASRLGVVVACTGPTDYVATPEGRVESITGGHPFLPLLTGSGCLASALVAAVAAVTSDHAAAAAAALRWLRWAAAAAAGHAAGPGTFAPALLDALFAGRGGEP